MDCKVALKKADGDLEKAQKFLREQGLDLLAHKNKDSLQGRVEAYPVSYTHLTLPTKDYV